MKLMTDKEYHSPHFFYRYGTSSPWPEGVGGSHTHGQYELIYFLRGDASYLVEERKYPLVKGDLIIVRPQEYHSILFHSDTEYERYNLLFDADVLGIAYAPEVRSRFEVVNLISEPATASIFPKLERYREQLPPKEFERAAIYLLFELFYDLSLIQSEMERSYSTVHPLLAEALSYISGNLFTVKSVSEVAKVLHITESHLFFLFRTHLKTTPRKYMTDKRIVAARELILLGNRPTEVASKCGFSEYTTFFRAYKKRYGIPPTAKHTDIAASKNITV